MDIKIKKIVQKGVTYKDSKGNSHTRVNYYLVINDNTWVAFRPSFAKGYTQIDLVAETTINSK